MAMPTLAKLMVSLVLSDACVVPIAVGAACVVVLLVLEVADVEGTVYSAFKDTPVKLPYIIMK